MRQGASPELVEWVDSGGHAHDVPAKVRKLLAAQYRGQILSVEGKRVLAFFNEEAVCVQKRKITRSPVNTAQVSALCSLE